MIEPILLQVNPIVLIFAIALLFGALSALYIIKVVFDTYQKKKEAEIETEKEKRLRAEDRKDEETEAIVEAVEEGKL